MLSFGLMTLNLSSEETYFSEVAKRAYALDIVCYRFTPSAIHPLTEKVTGERFNPTTNNWELAEFPLPDILYDRCFYRDTPHSNQCKAIVKWLKTRKDLLFLGHGLPNKLELYEALSQSELAPYLLHSKPITSGESFINGLVQQDPVLIKPVSGSQGRGIYYLEKSQREIIVQIDKPDKKISHIFPDYQRAADWVNKLIKQHHYLVQPYKELLDENNHPFDIRTLLQKDEAGNWQEICKGIRTGKKEGILSNLHAGGIITTFESWKELLPISQQEYICAEIADILLHLPIILEQIFPPLFELGVDIGVCKNGAIWILDINSKPGRKVALSINPELSDQLYSAPLLYGKNLVLQGKESYQ
ncbi:YheC/YheD family protein [Cytobacillus sp. FJAT-53684]|uniref:YheC/YheD family protein n=1 Tax=Cytobacillus mangrovibacter TaxID=3299024 RepID=A0ABW6K0I7_9BACI